MNLWLDDVRYPPEEGVWHWVKTYDAAINALNDHRWRWVSLDHDLADIHYPGVQAQVLAEHGQVELDRLISASEKTGYDVAYWMAENNIWPDLGVMVHSMNGVGSRRIQGVVDRYGPYKMRCLWAPRDLYGNPVNEVVCG